MAVEVIDKIKPKNGGSFPVVDAEDVLVSDGVRLPEALGEKAEQTDIEELSALLEEKANTSDVSELSTSILEKADVSDVSDATANLQAQIDNLITPVTEDAEVQNARIGEDGTSYQTLKERLDTENIVLRDYYNGIENNNYKTLADINMTDLSANKEYVNYTTGGTNTSQNFRATDYIPIESKQQIANTIWQMPETGGVGLAYYDSNKDFISGFQYPASGTSGYVMEERRAQAPEGAAYIRLSVLDVDKHLFKVKDYDAPLYKRLNEIDNINNPNRIYAIRGGLTDEGVYVANSYRASIIDIDVSQNKRVIVSLPESMTIVKVLEKRGGTYHLINTFNDKEISASNNASKVSIVFAHLDYDEVRITDTELYGIKVKLSGDFDCISNDLSGYNAANHISKEVHVIPVKYESGAFNVGDNVYEKLDSTVRLRTMSPIAVMGYKSLVLDVAQNYMIYVNQLSSSKTLLQTSGWIGSCEYKLREDCEYVDLTLRRSDNADIQYSESSNFKISGKSDFAHFNKILNEVDYINNPNRIYPIRGGLTDGGEFVSNSYRASIIDIDTSTNKRIVFSLPDTITIVKVLEKYGGTYHLVNSFDDKEIHVSDNATNVSISFAHLNYDTVDITDAEFSGIKVKLSGEFDCLSDDLSGYNAVNHIAKDTHVIPVKYESGAFNIGEHTYAKMSASTRLRTMSPVEIMGYKSLVANVAQNYMINIIQLDSTKMPIQTTGWVGSGEYELREDCDYVDLSLRRSDNTDIDYSESSNFKVFGKSAFAHFRQQNQTDTRKTDFLRVFTSFTGVGDSLMAGYTSDGTHTVNSATARAANNNWFAYLCNRVGRPFTNLAVGSSTAENWRYVNQSGTTDSDIEKANVETNCYMMGIGVNDIRQSKTVGSTSDIKANYNNNSNTFYGNYDYLINRLKTFNPYAKIFCFLIPSSEGNVTPYNNAIQYIANKYTNVYAINLESIESFQDAFIAGNFRAGHYNPMTYSYISCIIETAISEYIYENMSEFSWCPYNY